MESSDLFTCLFFFRGGRYIILLSPTKSDAKWLAAYSRTRERNWDSCTGSVLSLLSKRLYPHHGYLLHVGKAALCVLQLSAPPTSTRDLRANPFREVCEVVLPDERSKTIHLRGTNGSVSEQWFNHMIFDLCISTPMLQMVSRFISRTLVLQYYSCL